MNASFLGFTSLASVRLVSKHFEKSATPAMFRVCRIRMTEKGIQAVIRLAKSRVASLVQVLTLINAECQARLPLLSGRPLVSSAALALQSLPNLADLRLDFIGVIFVDTALRVMADTPLPQLKRLTLGEEFVWRFDDLLCRYKQQGRADAPIQTWLGQVQDVSLMNMRAHRGESLAEQLKNTRSLRLTSGVTREVPFKNVIRSLPAGNLLHLYVGRAWLGADTFIKLLERHGESLKSVTLRECRIKAGAWETVFELMASSCPQLVRVEISDFRYRQRRTLEHHDDRSVNMKVIHDGLDKQKFANDLKALSNLWVQLD